MSSMASSPQLGVQGSAPGTAGRFTTGPLIVLYIAGAKLLLHLLTANRYGYFGDELYYLACGEHLAWGYVDQPPLIAFIAWFVRHVLGTSLFAIHLLPAFAGAALVFLTGAVARQLGAGRFGQALAALSVASAGIFMVMHRLFTMNAFEPLIWTGCAYVVVRIIKTGNQKLWLWFGLLAGIGLENKYSMGVFGLGVLAGLLLTRERRAFAHKWIWIGGAIAFLIFLPNLIWNVQHHWPFFELMSNIRASGRDVTLGPLQFIGQQIFIMNPVTLPVWAAGVVWLLLSRTAKPYRPLGWAFVATFVFFFATKGKDYYVAPAYPMVMAAGSVTLERTIHRWHAAWLKPALVAIVLAITAVFLPIGVPVLPVDTYLRYQEALPFKLQPSERGHRAALPHHYAWDFGWEEMTAAVARVYDGLPPEERAKAAILGNNFAEAGAIDLLGARYGLPNAISGHQSYWLWGPRNYTGEVMIVIGELPADLQRICNSVEVGAELDNPYAQVWERRPVLVCRGLRANLQEVWPKFKDWD